MRKKKCWNDHYVEGWNEAHHPTLTNGSRGPGWADRKCFHLILSSEEGLNILTQRTYLGNAENEWIDIHFAFSCTVPWLWSCTFILPQSWWHGTATCNPEWKEKGWALTINWYSIQENEHLCTKLLHNWHTFKTKRTRAYVPLVINDQGMHPLYCACTVHA